MDSGFFYPFDTPKQIDAGKRALWALPRNLKQLGGIEVDERASVIHLNSTYVDIIDRWYLIRGGARSAMLAFLLPALIPGQIFLSGFSVFLAVRQEIPIALAGIAVCLLIPMAWICIKYGVKPILCREFFTYTHFPIRFNRKTRMIHVFRHNGPGGVLSVPWDDALFYIGQGTQDRDFLDLRGCVMDGDTVVDSFAVGHFSNSEQSIRGGWKFLVLYMEQGPQALPENMSISTSTRSCWRNCFLWARIFCSIFTPVPIIKWGFTALVTAARWLIMKSCKEPAWPADIEAESVIEPIDPYRLKEPAVTGEFENKSQNLAATQVQAQRRVKKR
ncbi:hypothetical protein EO087_10835 [Dyella sp. M7H15-1]|uniref:DUF6708 domain-containing protein n=1 Tax=Dyella sp. M7H15-1 TaxID=2501295 RepID=UPI0010050E9C|nr:DUF6708 domain-containing protein [Dyella sp. M7H15-1]QAU24424.1 hypothetical protein EO087_10835 [Dyella sp. M7H15-1]